MKKIWKIRKNSEAVSPVIATILMVAITVVLAAGLYVMVMGFGGDPGGSPTGALDETKLAAANTYRVTLLSISQNDVLNDSVTLIVTPAVTNAEYWHLVAGGTTIGAGDYVDLTTVAGTQYTVMLRDEATNNAIATLSFTAT